MVAAAASIPHDVISPAADGAMDGPVGNDDTAVLAVPSDQLDKAVLPVLSKLTPVVTTVPIDPLDTSTAASTTRLEPLSTRTFVSDAKVGLVVCAGVGHFDRTNRRHPERPSRISSIVTALTERGLWERCRILDLSNTSIVLDEQDYLRVHLPGYTQRLQRLSTCSCLERLDHEAGQYQSVYLTRESVQEARQAASALCLLTERVIASRCVDSWSDYDSLDHGFAIVRPPGHHAEPGLAGGYCLVNNVALAATRALAYRRHDDEPVIRRVCIVDWDVHHGNGTQVMFEADPRVLYISVHLSMAGTFYPQSGRYSDVGIGAGAGTTVNVAWSCPGMGDDEYLAAWECLVLPMLTEYTPDLVLISAGFDAATGDVGQCCVTPMGFAALTRRIQQTLCTNATSDGARPAPIVCTLEGGYAQHTLGLCVTAVVETLLHHDANDVGDATTNSAKLLLDTIHPSAAHNIRQTMGTQRPYWKFLEPKR